MSDTAHASGLTDFLSEVVEKVEKVVSSLPLRTAARILDFIADEEAAGRTPLQVAEDIIAKLAEGGF